MEPVRIVILGAPFTPIFELGDRIATYHNLDFITLESGEGEAYDYFGDNIPAKYLDTGDLMSGSASQHLSRDPSDWAKMKEMDEIYVDSPSEPLDPDEKEALSNEDFVVVSSEIPDKFLAHWSTATVLLTVGEEHAVEWINKRRKCPCCGAVYHLDERPPQRQGYCDRCGTHIFQSERDLPNNVRAQYRLWGRELWAIEKIMRERGNYVKVDISKFDTFEDIVHNVDRILRKLVGKEKEVNWNYSLNM